MEHTPPPGPPLPHLSHDDNNYIMHHSPSNHHSGGHLVAQEVAEESSSQHSVDNEHMGHTNNETDLQRVGVGMKGRGSWVPSPYLPQVPGILP